MMLGGEGTRLALQHTVSPRVGGGMVSELEHGEAGALSPCSFKRHPCYPFVMSACVVALKHSVCLCTQRVWNVAQALQGQC